MAKKATHGGARKGAGRPSVKRTKYTQPVTVSIIVPAAVLAAIDALAEAEGVKRGECIRQLLAKTKEIRDAFTKAEV